MGRIIWQYAPAIIVWTGAILVVQDLGRPEAVNFNAKLAQKIEIAELN
jgi:hypothetical protein